MSKVTLMTIIRSDNAEFIIDGILWGLTDLENFDHQNIQVFSEDNAIGDGSIFTGNRIGNIDRTFKAHLKTRDNLDLIRRNTISFFNPKYTFKVCVTYQNTSYYFDANLIGFSLPTGNVYNALDLTATFISDQPYLRSMDSFGDDINTISGNFGFPYMSSIDNGFTFGTYDFDLPISIPNDGDVQTNYTVIFTASGNVTHPSIFKNLSDGSTIYVKILDNMVSGDTITIDFDRQPISITKNGVNIINKVDKTSSFESMILDVGNNIIGFNADSGETSLSVQIYFNKLYLGV